MKKLITNSGLIFFLLLLQQSLFAQNTEVGTNPEVYSNFMIIAVIILIAAIFIGLGILDDPKYESQYNIRYNDSLLIPGYEFDKNITGKLTIAFYCAGLLALIYLILVILML